MNNIDPQLNFVLRFFRRGKFDPQRAWKKIAGPRIPHYFWLVPAAAAILLFVFIRRQNAWTEYRSYDVPQSFALVDGTRITLAPQASLRYQPHRNPRTVAMSGKVFYEVARDESHPFTVTLESARVQVLGTSFQVFESDSTVSVDVVSGLVRFSGTEGDGILLAAGQSAALSGSVPVMEASALPNAAAWATGRFHYDSTPLEVVLEELSAYYGVSLSAPAEGKCLTGDFTTDSLDEILELVEQALDVRIDRQSE